jgi:hypothetical protein
MKNSFSWIAVVSFLGLLLISCGAPSPSVEVQFTPTSGVVAQPSETPRPQTYLGESIELGEGTAQTWIRLDATGNPLAIGVQFTEAMLSGLPHSMQMIPIAMPPEASVTPFNHVLLDWNPHGHPPRYYSEPHFDFHFYIISQEEQMSIRSGVDKVRPEPAYIPAFYIPEETPSLVINKMGAHWLDSKAPELKGQTFIQTFVYGFLDGHLIFMEPMITKAFLETQPDVLYEISQPEKFEVSGYYPTRYAIRYDASIGQYNVSLENFVLR